nr:LCP family protein [Anaerolineae bacterium]
MVNQFERAPEHNLSNGQEKTQQKEGALARLDRILTERLGEWGTVIGISGLFGGTILLSLVVAVVLRALLSADALNPFSPDENGAYIAPNATPNPEFLAPTIELGNAPIWQGTDRVTVLVLGADTRPGQTNASGRSLTDSMMLLMIDPERQVASVLSIPRDLYVDIPGYGLNRINTAYLLGGGELAIATVEYNLGIRVNHYMVMEFNAFVIFIDEIGGIDIYVPQEINDPFYPDMNYGFDPFYISAGQHHMDGATALKYARTRHTPDVDFGRAQRQQDILFAVRNRILSLNMLPTLIQKSPVLYATLSDSITTDLTLEQLVSLALLAQEVERDFIRTGVIDYNYTEFYTTSSGAQVLIPNRENIGYLLSQVFWLELEAQ